MAKIIKNLSGAQKVYAGMTLEDQASYQIQNSELLAFQSSDLLVNDISQGIASIYSDTSSTEITGASGIKFLMDYSDGIVRTDSFSSKTYAGKKLYRRKHGVNKTILAGQEDTLSMVIPYTSCKINKIEICGCKIGDKVDLKVYDTPTGTISTVPNYMLNQFGFDVEMTKDSYIDESNYDADLIQNMKIELTYKNNGPDPIYIGANFTLHQVV